MRKLLTMLFALTSASVLLYGCGSDDHANEYEQIEGDQIDLSTYIDESSIPETIATVNGEEINKDIFIATFENAINTQGVSEDDENKIEKLNEIQDDIINKVIDERLLTQAANDNDVTVSEEEIDEKLLPFTAQFETEEELEKKLKEEGFTMKELRDDIERLLKLDKYISEHITTEEITEEQLKEAYAQIVQAANDTKIPEYDEYKDVVYAQVQYEQQEEQMNELIEKLRQDSEIEVFVEKIK